MKRLLFIALLLIAASIPGFGQALTVFNGDCSLGGQAVVLQGLKSAGTQPITAGTLSSGSGVMASFPRCSVTVYLTGTLTKVSLFSNNLASPTPLSNPFNANADGTYSLFTSPACVDIVMNTGSGPTMPTARTYTDVCLGVGNNPPITQVAFSATPSFVAVPFATFNMTLTGNVTSSTISGGFSNELISFWICQDATGGRTFAWPASFFHPPTVAPAANACTDQTFFFDGTNWRPFAASGDSLVAIFGGTLNGNFGGNPNFIGNPSFSGNPTLRTINNVQQVDGVNNITVAAAIAALGGAGVVDARGCLGTKDLSGLNIPSNVFVYLGPCTYTASTTITNNSQEGFGLFGVPGDVQDGNSGTVIQWTGSVGGNLTQFRAPQWASFYGVTFDCNARTATRGLYLQAVTARATQENKFDHVQTKNCSTAGLQLNNATGGDPTVAINDNTFYDFKDLGSNTAIISDNQTNNQNVFFRTTLDGASSSGSLHAITNLNGGQLEFYTLLVITPDGSGYSGSVITDNQGGVYLIHDGWVDQTNAVRCFDDASGGTSNPLPIVFDNFNCVAKDGGNVSMRFQTSTAIVVRNSTLAGSISVGVAPTSLESRSNTFTSANKYAFDGGRVAVPNLSVQIFDADGTIYVGQIGSNGAGYNNNAMVLRHTGDNKVYLNPSSDLSTGNVVEGVNIHPLTDSNGTLGTALLRYNQVFSNTLVLSGGSGNNATFTHSNTGPRTYTFQDNTGAITETIGTGSVTTAGTAVTNGTCQAQTGITVTGALTSDSVVPNIASTLPATWQTGIQLSAHVTASNTVTVYLCNPTAGSITPAAAQVNVRVLR